MTNPDFYAGVARKFGGYVSRAQRTKVFHTADPEMTFEEIVAGLGTSERDLLDVGCADGRNVLKVAPRYRHVTAIDLAQEMLDAAERNRVELDMSHVDFDLRDAAATGLADATFDVVSSRRGPLVAGEFWRLLRSGGSLVYAGIGERDVQSLKEVFGRGQQYGMWDTSILSKERQLLENEGFRIELAEDVWFDEYFHSRADLCRFLQVVPIFEEFDLDHDADNLDRYIAEAESEMGIKLSRHWILLRALKP